MLHHFTHALSYVETYTVSPLFPLHLLTFLHAVKSSYFYRKSIETGRGRGDVPWLQGVVSTLIMSLGGTAMVAILLSQPPTLLAVNTVVPTYLLGYFLIFHSYNDILYSNLIEYSHITDPVMLAIDSFCRAIALTSSGVDAVRQSPLGINAYVGQILCGTLAGIGGGILDNAFGLSAKSWKFGTPDTFTIIPHSATIIFWCSTLYTFLRDNYLWNLIISPWHYMTSHKCPQPGKDEARLLICVIAVGAILSQYFLEKRSPSMPATPAKVRSARKAKSQ